MKGKDGIPRRMIRVLLVDDSASARLILRGMLESAPDMEVVGEAGDGHDAVTLARSLRPSLITMDVDMPGLDGLSAIEEIMTSRAIPILVVSGTASAHTSYEAISRGALEVIPKPDLDGAALFLERIRILAGVPVITHLRRRRPAAATTLPVKATASSPPPPSPSPHPREMPMSPVAKVEAGPPAFAIATSTGGPQALAEILPRLPANFGAPVFVAQHIAVGFAQGMAEWLGGLCRMQVKLAEAGMPIQAGTVYVAPSEWDMRVTPAHTIHMAARQPNQVYRPSCDALLSSVAEVYGAASVGIILTGMGRDGVEGLRHIRRAGGKTLAQDEASSLIYGMNGIAVDLGLADRVRPLEAIADEMIWLEKTLRAAVTGAENGERP